MLKKSVSKAAGELKPEADPLGYVEDFDEPRTKLADFFSILLEEPALLEVVFVNDGSEFGEGKHRGRCLTLPFKDGGFGSDMTI